MAVKGHYRKKPDALKKIQGTYRPYRASKTEDLPPLSKLPPTPDKLKESGKIYYEQQGNKLLELGILNEYNLPLFIDICFYIYRKNLYMQLLEETDDLNRIRTLQNLFDNSHKSMRLAMTEFGLTPASIHRIIIPKKDDKTDFEKFQSE